MGEERSFTFKNVNNVCKSQNNKEENCDWSPGHNALRKMYIQYIYSWQLTCEME